MLSRPVASRAGRGIESLVLLLAENGARAHERERELARRVTAADAPPVILFGAGGLGRRLCAALAAAGAPPTAFTDNDQRLWGTRVDGTTVLAPTEAAARYGVEGLFVVSVWNPRHAFVDTAQQLHGSGCREVVSWIRLAWGLEAGDVLPLYSAGRPSSVLAAANHVTRAASLWADSASREEFERQVRWRLSGDFGDLAGPVADQYFPRDLLSLRAGEAFVDCGAFDGDTLRELVNRCPEFASVDAFEPDPANFAALEGCAAALTRPSDDRVRLHRAATDREGGRRRFSAAGAAGAFVETPASEAAGCEPAHGTRVPCVTLDDVLEGVPVTFIKMDVEGAEADTLLGAQRLLRERRPVVAVSSYHHQADVWQLPALVAALTEDYRLHLRAHCPDGFDCVLYGIPVERGEP